MALSNSLLTGTWTHTARSRVRHACLSLAGISALSLAAVMNVGSAQPSGAGSDLICGPAPVMTEHGGKLDYRLRFTDERVRHNVALVDQYHTSLARKAIASGQSGYGVLGDIDFSLRHSPNHHEALKLLVDYDRAGGRPYDFAPVPCYFRWAREYAPDDTTVLALNALYHWHRDELRVSAELFDAALAIDPSSAELNYNAGLLHVELGNFARARRLAHAAYEKGYPLPGLRTRLQRVGEWVEPTTTGQESSN